MYRVLYRKWRPTGFSDVIGQPHVTSTLKNEINTGRISHAYLFTGSRGTGKTTCAKILARAVNCLDLNDGEPCGKCANCVGIANGNIMDVVEMDAASNNSVNNIRDVLDEVMFTPSEARYRVYIIDEVHMLSTGAFNALLKTLEEPPPHVIFILATTEVHKLPATILSRCQRFDFNRIDPNDIANRLQYIANEENVSIDKDAALLIAAVADGAMRDALSILDRCIGLSSRINSDTVREATGLAGRDYLFSLAGAVNNGDIPAAIDIINELHKASKSISRLCEELTEHFRTLMLLKTMKDKAKDLIILSRDEMEQAKVQAESMSLTQIVYCIDVLQGSLERMFRGGNNRIEFETCVIKLCSPKLSTDVEAMLTRIDKLERSLRASINTDKGQEIPPPRPVADQHTVVNKTAEQSIETPADSAGAAGIKNSFDNTASVKQVETKTPYQSHSPVPPVGRQESIDKLIADAVPMEQWEDVLDVMKSYTRVTAAAFRETTAYVSGDYIFIDAKDDTPFRHLRNPSQREKMRAAIKEVTGKSYKLGPYKRIDNTPKNEDSHSKLDEFIEHISNSDIKITIED